MRVVIFAYSILFNSAFNLISSAHAQIEKCDKVLGKIAPHGGDENKNIHAQVLLQSNLNAVKEIVRGPDAKVFTGTVEIERNQVVLRTADGKRYLLATDTRHTWASRWGGEVGSFRGQTVTVKAFPDAKNGALLVTEFAPGSSPDFVLGRVKVTDDGKVFMSARAGKDVEVTNPVLAAKLRVYDRVALILPGPVEFSEAAGYRFNGNPDDVYMLTKINPGDRGVYFADTPFEKTHLSVAAGLGSALPNEKMGARIFVHGKLVDAPASAAKLPHRRFFEVNWLSDPIEPEWTQAAEKLGSSSDFDRGLSTVATPHPGLSVFKPVVAAVDSDKKTGSTIVKGIKTRWFDGRKLESGPVDALNQPHGQWEEYSSLPTLNGEVRNEVTLRGNYEHGKRQGLWTQIIDGKPQSAWTYENGVLKAAGHTDAAGRPHGAWTLVAEDQFLDGGEGDYYAGKKIAAWYFYAPGTTTYNRTELYTQNGVLAANGPTKKILRDGVDRVERTGVWTFFDESGKKIGTHSYPDEVHVDAEARTQELNGATWTWSK